MKIFRNIILLRHFQKRIKIIDPSEIFDFPYRYFQDKHKQANG